MSDGATLTLPANALQIALALAVAAVLAGTLALILAGLVRRFFATAEHDRVGPAIATSTVRLIRLAAFLILFIVFAFPALDLAGVPLPVGLQSGQLGRWAAGTGLRIAVLVVLAVAVVRLLGAVIARAETELAVGTSIDALERRKRTQTVARLVRRVIAGLVWATVVLMILGELDVNITPVLTGAGILGLAVGFGAQTLVRDVISGFFLIIEDQVRVGDVASVNGTGGSVEQINLRTIVLRDLDGTVHVFPNGAITTLSNMTKDFSFYVIELAVPYDEDTDRVIAVAVETTAALRREPKYGASMLEPLEVLGVDGFGNPQVTVKVRVKTAPLKQWEVGRELRRRLNKAFQAKGIRLAVPQMNVAVQQPQQPPPAPASTSAPASASDDKAAPDAKPAP